ncbi:hypothetical protein ZEAMMB73_Zm00001d018746 [Zea mays]|uniref:Uncharacterized protein n=1 Tax=Zea mays TaxID=4577 RepID=A0A1D6HRW5_MAIZE|nr:hypothetical protein ZEAMMB73_Zm00001d018746 [Zea mays]
MLLDASPLLASSTSSHSSVFHLTSVPSPLACGHSLSHAARATTSRNRSRARRCSRHRRGPAHPDHTSPSTTATPSRAPPPRRSPRTCLRRPRASGGSRRGCRCRGGSRARTAARDRRSRRTEL